MDNFDELTLLHLFHQCSHQLHASGRFHGQNRLLILLSEHGSLTQRELITITGRRSATLSEQLENMEKAGYITRARNEMDRRNVDVFLTSLGEEAARDAIAHRQKRARLLFSGLDQEERKQLSHLLHKLSSSWKELDPESEAAPK